MSASPSAHLVDPRRIAVACGAVVALLGATVLTAWAFGVEGLKHLQPAWPAMKANTALAFLALGSAMALAARGGSPALRRTSRLLAVATMAIGALTLAEYLAQVSLGIDELLVRDDEQSGAFPGRPSLLAALDFVLLAWAIVRWERPRPATSGMAVGAGFVAMANLMFSAVGAVPPIPGSAVAVHTTVGFVVLVVGILLGQPGPVSTLLLGRGRSSTLARWLLTPVVLLPLGLVFGIRLATRAGLLDLAQAIGLAAFLDLAALVLIVLGLALRLRQDEAALASARAHERAITETAQDAIVTAGPDGVIRTANAATEAMFGRPVAGLVGSPLTSLLRERFPEAHGAGFERYLAAGAAHAIGRPVELVAMRADGSEFPLELVLGAGQVEGAPFFTAILRDVSERVRTRQALEDQARRTDLAEQATGRGSWEWDVTVDRAVWSKGMYRLFGLDPATFVNSNENFLAMVHPDDRPRMGQAIADALARPGKFLQDYRLRRPDGSEIAVRGEGSVRTDQAGRATMLYGFVQDVTEVRRMEAAQRLAELQVQRSQERFARIFEASPVAIGLTKADGQILDANAAFAQLTGYTREELTRPGFSAAELYDDPRDREEIVGALRKHGIVRERELSLRRKDGAFRKVLISLEFLDLGGNTTILSVFQDITERVRLQSEREERIAVEAELERLRRTDRFREEFINSTAHELRTPLTPLVLGVASLKPAVANDERNARILANVERASERLRRVVNDMVAAADLQTRSIALERKRLDLTRQLGAAVAAHAAAARRSGVALEEPADSGLWVWADEARLQLVLGHLLGNAIKFTPAGGRVTLSSRPWNDAARVEVADTGVGLTAQQLAGLWRPYAQAHEKSQKTDSGSGLGLYVAKGMVELHGGHVGAESAGPGKGSTFWFTLPLDPGSGGPRSVKGPADPGSKPATTGGEEGTRA